MAAPYFTVETHIRHLDEVKALELINVTTQVLAGKGKKCHVFHRLSHADGRMLATAEQLLIHVDMDSRSACEPTAQVTLQLEKNSSCSQLRWRCRMGVVGLLVIHCDFCGRA